MSLILNPYNVGGLALTQKGYGPRYIGSDTSDLVMSYAAVTAGSAPAAGDLVIWMAFGYDDGSTPVVDLTGSGWVQSSAYTGNCGATLLAKVVTAGDLSSPATMIDNPTDGSIGFWVCYSVSGSITSLTIPTFNWEFSLTAAPSSQVVDSSALNPPAVAISIAGGGGDDGNQNLQIAGATADIDLSSPSNQWINTNAETRWMVNLAIGGANITFSKNDDGNLNHLASAYVSVS